MWRGGAVVKRVEEWFSRAGFSLCLLAWCFFVSDSVAELELPQWTKEERRKLERGEIIPGASLLVDDGESVVEQLPKPEKVEALPEPPPQPEYDPRMIPSKHLAAYFQQAPGSFLIDPQRLLTMQERMDREGFLQYHAEDSGIDVRLYLFDALQRIPSPYSLSKLVGERYASGPPTAVVCYFVGDPSRTMLAFGGEGADKIDAGNVRKILASSMVKSLEESEPAEQVEAFIVQLSIKLYWLEKSLREDGVTVNGGQAGKEVAHVAGDTTGKGGKPAGVMARLRPHLTYLLIGLGGLFLCVVSAFSAVYLWRRNRHYRFPVLELPCRLGADYGAGVGAVIGFSDVFGSPASQRDQVPDYLLRKH